MLTLLRCFLITLCSALLLLPPGWCCILPAAGCCPTHAAAKAAPEEPACPSCCHTERPAEPESPTPKSTCCCSPIDLPDKSNRVDAPQIDLILAPAPVAVVFLPVAHLPLAGEPTSAPDIPVRVLHCVWLC